MKSLGKYYFGILTLGLLTAALVVFVLIQGASGRQDTKTLKAAKDAAEKINDYILANDAVPDSLDQAGVKNAPNSIRYTKKSVSEFDFCATYKQSNKVGIGSIDQILSGYTASGLVANSSYYDNYGSSYLYINDEYKAGENCQTIKPYIYNYDSSLQSQTADFCDPADPDYETYREYC